MFISNRMWPAYILERNNKSIINLSETIRSHLTFKVHSLQRIHWNPVWFLISNIKINSTIVMPLSRTAGDLSEPAICTVRQSPGWFYLRISPGTAEQLHLDVLHPCCRTLSPECFSAQPVPWRPVALFLCRGHSFAGDIFFPLYFKVIIYKTSSNPWKSHLKICIIILPNVIDESVG